MLLHSSQREKQALAPASMCTPFWSQEVPSLVRGTVCSHPQIPLLRQEWPTGRLQGKRGAHQLRITPLHLLWAGQHLPEHRRWKEEQSGTLNLDADRNTLLTSSPSYFHWKKALIRQWLFVTGQLGSRCPGQSFPLICRGLSALGCWLRQHRLQVSRCSWVSLPAKCAGPEDRQLCPPKESGEVGPSPSPPSPPPSCLCPSEAAASATLPAVDQGPGELPTLGASPPAVHATPCAQRVASGLCSEGWLR